MAHHFPERKEQLAAEAVSPNGSRDEALLRSALVDTQVARFLVLLALTSGGEP
jgi:hypothetical protein